MKNESTVADAIRAEIARHEDMIEKLRTALAALDGAAEKPARGRPAGRKKAARKQAKKKRKMSAAGRKRMAEAAKARWAKFRAEKGV